MTLNQFVAPPDALTLKRDEQAPFTNVTAGDFAELMKKVVGLYGLPQSVESLTVFSTDRDVLNHRSPEESEVIESAFAVGAMPDLFRRRPSRQRPRPNRDAVDVPTNSARRRWRWT